MTGYPIKYNSFIKKTSLLLQTVILKHLPNVLEIDLGSLVERSMNHGYENGSCSITQKQGVNTFLPK